MRRYMVGLAGKKVLWFNGVDNYVKLPKLTLDEWTVEVVIKPLSHDLNYDTILMFGDWASDSYIWWDANASTPGFSMGVVINGTRYMTRLNWRPELGRWYVLHFMRSLAGEHRIYVNGRLELTGSDPGGPLDHDANPTAIGGDLVRNYAYTNSVIALLRVYERVLPEKIARLKNDALNLRPASIRDGLVLELIPDTLDCTNGVWRDNSGHGNDGVIYGAKCIAV